MIDPTLSAAATATLETVINRALDYDPGTRVKLARLEGKCLSVVIEPIKIEIALHFDAEGVRITQRAENPTTRLTGSLSALLSLALSDQVNLARSGVQAWGSTALLTDVKVIAAQLDIDWEEALNDLLGDLLGHPLAQVMRTQLGWIKARARSGKRLLQEFLTEELRALPSEIELHDFAAGVDELRLAADRAEARLKRLLQRTPKDTTG